MSRGGKLGAVMSLISFVCLSVCRSLWVSEYLWLTTFMQFKFHSVLSFLLFFYFFGFNKVMVFHVWKTRNKMKLSPHRGASPSSSFSSKKIKENYRPALHMGGCVCIISKLAWRRGSQRERRVCVCVFCNIQRSVPLISRYVNNCFRFSNMAGLTFSITLIPKVIFMNIKKIPWEILKPL